jgi:hypothetical protein
MLAGWFWYGWSSHSPWEPNVAWAVPDRATVKVVSQASGRVFSVAMRCVPTWTTGFSATTVSEAYWHDDEVDVGEEEDEDEDEEDDDAQAQSAAVAAR